MTSADGATTEAIDITITGANDAAVISSTTSTGDVVEDGTQIATGDISIADTDTGEASYAATTLVGSYGTLVIDTDNNTWAYTLDNDNASVQALPDGDTLIDSITVTSADGATTEAIDITIMGANDAPTISSTSFNAAENQTTVGAVVADDVDTNDTLTYSISGGADADLFDIDSSGNITLDSALNYENATDNDSDGVYNIEVQVGDGTTNTTQNIAITVTDVNEAPTINTTSFSIDENQTTVGTIDAEDIDNGDSITSYSIVGGDDQSLFNIHSETGAITFISAPDFEVAGDNGGDNDYQITVRVSDGELTTDKAITVSVQDVNAAPTDVAITGATTAIDENTSTASAISLGTVSITDDGEGTNSVTLTGADAASFEIVDGELRLKAGVSLDYETQTSYNVTVNVDDSTVGATPDATTNYTLTINDVNETPIINTAVVFDRFIGRQIPNDSVIYTIDASDPEGADLTYAILDPSTDPSVPQLSIDSDGNITVTNGAAIADSGTDNLAYVYTISISDGNTEVWTSLSFGVVDDASFSGSDVTYNFIGQDQDAIFQGSSLNDTIIADGNSQTLFGGTGDDHFTAAGGDDTITGGAGSDTYYYSTGDGSDVITDFNTTDDTLDLTGTEIYINDATEFAEYKDILLTQSGDDTIVNLPGADQITLKNITPAELSFDDFTFNVTTDLTSSDTDLSTASLTSSEGITISGLGTGNISDRSVTNVGDINQDGYDDFAIASYSNNEVTVVYGGHDLADSSMSDIQNSDGELGFTITRDAGGSFGFSVTGGADVNGDGINDFAISAIGANTVYVVYGGQQYDDGFDISELNADEDSPAGMVVTSATTQFGHSIDFVNFDNDGFADIVVGADVGGATKNLSSYIVFGSDEYNAVNTSNADDYSLSINPNTGLSGDLGKTVANLGDINDDGYEDVALGLPFADIGVAYGGGYIVYGSADNKTDINLANEGSENDDDHVSGLGGGQNDDALTWSMSSLGDVNGDGIDDYIVGTYSGYDGGKGRSYIVFGEEYEIGVDDEDDHTTVTDLRDAPDASKGIVLRGHENYAYVGVAVAGASNFDFNGDGYNDILVTAKEDDSGASNAGEAYVIFGKPSGESFSSEIYLDSMTADVGMKITGDVVNNNFSSITVAGDVNGDGISDIVIDGLQENHNAYVIYGSEQYGRVNYSNDTDSASVIFGEEGDETITGTSDDDYISGQGGHDTLLGGAGDDTILGGEGNDYLVGGTGDDTLTGGTGNDEFVFNPGDGADIITDFNENGVDVINLVNVTDIVVNDTDEFDIFKSAYMSQDGNDVIINLPGVSDQITLQNTTLGDLNINDFKFNLTNVETTTPNLLSDGSVDLADLDGANGFTISGDNFDGRTVMHAGDINGDGIDDMLIADAPLSGNAHVHVVYGSENASNIDLTNLETTEGFTIGSITGTAGGNPIALASLGDINNDGYDDFMYGVSYDDTAGTDAGKVVIVHGGDSLGNTTSTTISGLAAGDNFGSAVANLGDVNGDGFNDIMIAAPGAGANDNGAAYVLYGNSNGTFQTDVANLNADGLDGFVMTGAADDDGLGYRINALGDINGDGNVDFAVSQNNSIESGTSETYVVFGGYDNLTTSSDLNLSDLDGDNGFKITAASSIALGESISSGDINDDGYEDIMLTDDAGNLYVVLGNGDAYAASMTVTQADTADYFHITTAGLSSATLSDVNNDGYDDIIIGYNTYDDGATVNTGKVSVIYGGDSFDGSLDVTTLDGTDGFTIVGQDAQDMIGISVSGGGDYNADGNADYIIGTNSNESYVIFGNNSDGYEYHQLTASADTFTGGSEAEYIQGTAGNDTIAAGHGDDVIHTGTGDDTVYAGSGDDLIFGGAGADTLYGREGDDQITGGAGDDTLHGGEGVDTFVHTVGDGADTIADFNTADDVIDISGHGFVVDENAFADFIADTTYVNESAGTTTITLPDGGSIVLTGVAKTDLSFANFTFSTDHSNSTAPAQLALGDMTVNDGIRITDLQDGNQQGHSISNIGDINNDGYDDVLIGRSISETTNESYVVFGSNDAPLNLSVDDLDGSNGFELTFSNTASGANHHFGYAVSDAGDINNDGIADFMVSSHYADQNSNASGAVYVVFGGNDDFGTGEFDLSSLNGSNGFVVEGSTNVEYGHFGASLASVEDYNGDGINDIVIGAYGHSVGTTLGASYVVFGKDTGFSAVIDVSSLDDNDSDDVTANVTDSSLGAVFEPGFNGSNMTNDSAFGYSVASGDFNNDGISDVALAAPYEDTAGANSGSVYVMLGKDLSSGSIPETNINDLGVGEGITIRGAVAGELFGWSVDFADVNNDGVSDLIVGAQSATANGIGGAGKTYVIFGGDTLDDATTFDVSTLDGSNGFVVEGFESGAYSGYSVANIGDFNGDGIEDFAVNAQLADSATTIDVGETYIIYGKTSGYPATINLGDLTATDGFIIEGEYRGRTGNTVDGGGDVNGDGFADVLLSSETQYGVSNDAPNYVIYGGNQFGRSGVELTDQTNIYYGTDSNENIMGGTQADVIKGGAGSDVIDGGAGNDTLTGGAGKDYFAFSNHTGDDTITDFTVGEDKIDLSGYDNVVMRDSSGFAEFVSQYMSEDGSDVLINLPGAGTVRVDNVSLSEMNSSDNFIFNQYYGEQNGDVETLQLGDMTVDQGFEITDLITGLNTGRSVANIGDINDDGYDDFMIGRSQSETVNEAFVVYGGDDIPLNLSINDIDGSNGFELTFSNTASGANHHFGYAVSGAGDINNDGIDDFMVSSHYADQNSNASGAVYVVFGGNDDFGTGEFDLSSLNGSNGFVVEGSTNVEYGHFGASLASVEDYNGDGINDIVIGAYGHSVGTTLGASYVVFGKDTGFSAVIDVSSLDDNDSDDVTANVTDSSLGAVFEPGFNGSNMTNDSAFGYSVASGDFNNDGISDVALAAPYEDTAGANSGSVYVMLGKDLSSGSIPETNINDLGVGEGITIRGAVAGELFGWSVDFADVNNDGVSDLIVGAQSATANGIGGAGKTYVIFGGDTLDDATTFDVSTLDGSNGFVVEGFESGAYSGYSVANAGDFNGDGIEDFIVNAQLADSATTIDVGESYIIFGRDTGNGETFPATLNLGNLSSTDGFIIEGEYRGRTGVSVDGGGDINGDGFADVILGAEVSLGSATGSSNYVVYGGAQYGRQQIDLAAGDNFYQGNDAPEYIISNSGDDVINAGGGNDVIEAGTGDDIINGGTGNDRLTGGDGADSFVFDSSSGDDIITDFTTGTDSIDMSALSDLLVLSSSVFEGDFKDLFMTENNGDTTITFSENNTLTLQGVSKDDLSYSDFNFHSSNTPEVDAYIENGGTAINGAYGTSGDDLLYAGYGQYGITADAYDGDDLIVLNPTANHLDQAWGRAGNDTFILDAQPANEGSATYYPLDFTAGSDKLDVREYFMTYDSFDANATLGELRIGGYGDLIGSKYTFTNADGGANVTIGLVGVYSALSEDDLLF